ncbi:Hypothetical Protein RSKD131_3302 [Cereibacter sphaeroides KD131]|nr:Hypothetical Protein RSKD131_3302 [Cereibacter sphaeroides KD131]
MPPAADDGSGVGHAILSQRRPRRPTGFRPVVRAFPGGARKDGPRGACQPVPARGAEISQIASWNRKAAYPHPCRDGNDHLRPLNASAQRRHDGCAAHLGLLASAGTSVAGASPPDTADARTPCSPSSPSQPPPCSGSETQCVWSLAG